MKNILRITLFSPFLCLNLILLIIMLLSTPGIAQKGYSHNSNLEIDNLAPQKEILIFDTNQRLDPDKYRKRYKIKNKSSDTDIRLIADDYLNQKKDLLFINDLNTNFQVEKILKSPAGTHLHYQEYIERIPVYDSKIVVSVNQYDVVSFVSRNYYPNLKKINQQYQLQPEQAIESAQNYLNVSGTLRGTPTAEKMIFKSKINGVFFTYRVEIPARSPFGDWEIFVDAISGDIIHVKNLIIYKDGTDGKGFVWDPDPLTTKQVYYGGDFSDNDDQNHDSLNAQRIMITLNDLYTDNNGKYVLEGPFVKLSDRSSPDDEFPHLSHPDSFFYTREEQAFEAVMVYYHIDKSYRRLLELGFFTEDTLEGLKEFEADPHGNFGLDNSFYSPLLNYCAFGEGGVDDAEDAAVIWHEYEHAVQYNISAISSNADGETRSLLEGCSDCWAASYNRRNFSFGWNHIFLWDAGIKSASGDTTFWAGRRCDLDWIYSKEDSTEYAGTHAFGQIWSSALMQIWSSLGADITDKIFISSHYYWGIHPDFDSAAEAFIQADLDIYDGLHLPLILRWFEYYNIIKVRDYQPEILHNPLTDVQMGADSYQISCQIFPSKAVLDTGNVWLIWSLDSSFTDSSHLRAVDSNDVFVTEIPAVFEPSTVNYYFSVRDSLDIIAVNPVNAPEVYYSFYAGPDSLPPPPRNIEITDSINVVDLYWEEILTGKYISYNIYKSVNGLNFLPVDSVSSTSYTDTSVVIGWRYYYYITTVFNQWESNPSDTVNVLVQAITSLEKNELLPNVYQLQQNFPNPFNPTTIINYELQITNEIELSVYNLLGQKVATLVSGKQAAGYHHVEWDASGFASGIYYYRLEAGEFVDVKKMILIR